MTTLDAVDGAGAGASASSGPDVLTAERIEVSGVVQGVGFRPFVFGLATELGLAGRVGNDSAKVVIEVAGPADAIGALVERLLAERPPLARIDRLDRVPVEPGPDRLADGADGAEGPRGFDGFRIVASGTADGPRTLVPPDTAVCAECLSELFDPNDRRHGHPFITCTNCGPRYTIITDLPYDRAATTMADFAMCPACAAEYSDPGDRRYHAQPICCPRCGPRLGFRRPAGGSTTVELAALVPSGAGPIAAAVAALTAGAIVAVKGLGGYHLAADATSDRVVGELRRRKARADKPFAVMVADLDRARELAEITTSEATLLTGPAAPIVLLRARSDSPLSDLVAPGNPLIGILLPSTPIHHLLATAHPSPLIMTSANRGGEPLAWTAERIDELGDLVDGVLDHDRPIHQPCDDSVVRVVGGRLLPLRRARGYAPIPIDVPPVRGSADPSPTGPVLAAGAELKNTFCLLTGGQAAVSQHIGDMENLATLDAFDAAVARTLDLHRAEPTTIVADAHPDYLSSRWARRAAAAGGRNLVEVQHHHAHVAAVLAEHQLDPASDVIGVAFDGTGYGTDAAIWGGEVFVGSVLGFDRMVHLAPVPLPGGDAAVREPARMALAHLHAAGIDWGDDLPAVAHLATAGIAADDGGPPILPLLRRQLERGIGCVPTTSMGRLFDAVASLIGLRHRISFEAQAAIDLELAAVDGAVADRADPAATRYHFDRRGPVADPTPMLRALVADLSAGVPVPVLAWRFHRAVIDLVVGVADDLRDGRGLDRDPRRRLDTVALTGGVFQNALLTERSVAALEAGGFRVLTHSLVPPNDGGLSLGQAWIAANRPSGDPATGPTPTRPQKET